MELVCPLVISRKYVSEPLKGLVHFFILFCVILEVCFFTLKSVMGVLRLVKFLRIKNEFKLAHLQPKRLIKYKPNKELFLF